MDLIAFLLEENEVFIDLRCKGMGFVVKRESLEDIIGWETEVFVKQ